MSAPRNWLALTALALAVLPVLVLSAHLLGAGVPPLWLNLLVPVLAAAVLTGSAAGRRIQRTGEGGRVAALTAMGLAVLGVLLLMAATWA